MQLAGKLSVCKESVEEFVKPFAGLPIRPASLKGKVAVLKTAVRFLLDSGVDSFDLTKRSRLEE